ncbi:MAG: roadblock/LC7 domain-containing protein [Methanoregula sp.]|jgi:predicted regulator of Ras-like GTPase activity (Roadblock/LC7/MglB family)
MKLPAGIDGGTITNPRDEEFFNELSAFRGAVEIRTPAGTGFILVDEGRLQAAMFRTATDAYQGASALSCLTTDSGDEGAVQTFHLRRYNDVEMERAVEICRDAGLLIPVAESPEPVAGMPQAEPAEHAREPSGTMPELDKSKLQKILSQPGVIAVSAFFEGFPVQSMGDADFEHVAASAEDFMRAGVKIAEEMKAGPLEQMILETADNKFIIAPCGDLFLCVFTTADTQLGLIRVVLKSIQSETCH